MHVAVVGAGPAGAATALLLARFGVEVTLFERETSFDRVFRGEGLMPSGMDALFQMGLGPLLDSIPSRLAESWNIWMEGREVFVIPEPREELGERALRVASQPALLEGMVAEASRFPQFHFERGTRVRDLLREGERVVGVRVEAGGETREVKADLVIGCDGRGSPLRRQAGLELEGEPEQYDVLWCKLPAPERLRGRCAMFIMVAAGHDPAFCYTSWDGQLQYGVVLPKGSLGRVREGDWVEAAVASAPGWLAEHVLSHRDQIDGPIPLSVPLGRCRQWTVPGLLLLGDAAHPMSPVRAQGINLALRDAIVAANHVVPAILSDGKPGGLDEATRAVQAERELEIVRAQALQRQEGNDQAMIRKGGFLYRFGRTVVPLVGRFQWAQTAWLGQQRPLRHGVTEVKLRQDMPTR